MNLNKHIVIVGAGLGGAYLAALLAKEGYQIDVFEKRNDLRSVTLPSGKSVNLGLSKRGLTALDELGLKEAFLDMAIPMYGRMIHTKKGKSIFIS